MRPKCDASASRQRLSFVSSLHTHDAKKLCKLQCSLLLTTTAATSITTREVALRGAPVPQSVSSKPCEGFTNDGSPIYCKQLRQDPNAKHTHWTLIKMTLWTSSLTIKCSNVTFKCILGSYTSALDCNLKRTMFNKTSSLGLLICIVSFRFDTLHFAKMSQMTSFEAVMSWLHPS